jgi:hypothetical protein
MLCFCKRREAYVHLMQFVGHEPTKANLAKAEKIDLCKEGAEEKRVNDPARQWPT